MHEVDTGILCGWFCPLLRYHLGLVERLYKKHDTITFSLLTRIEDPTQHAWPQFSKAEISCCMNFWERSEATKRAVLELYPSVLEKFLTVPMFVWKQDVLFNPTFFPKQRSWYFVKGDYNWVASQLVARGESVNLIDPDEDHVSEEKVIQDLVRGSPCDHFLPESTKVYLDEIHIELRLEQLSIENSKDKRKEVVPMTGGTQFYGSVTVHGSIVNIEGSQYNVDLDPKEKVLAVVGAIVKKGLHGSDILSTLTALSENIDSRGDIGAEEIADAVNSTISGQDVSDSGERNLRTILEQLALGASGSLLATGIVQGIKLFLGIP